MEGRDTPQNPLYERYASPEMARIFAAGHRYGLWRELWITLAECQRELGLPITEAQIAALRRRRRGSTSGGWRSSSGAPATT